MSLDNIDDLFRQKLDGHATPPSEALWARLHQSPPAATDDDDSVDTLLRAGLAGHASQPRRELWERLEDEHLRPQPRRRRVAGWWQFSAAAVLLLSLLAGGGLWWRGSSRPAGGGAVASASKGGAAPRSTAQALRVAGPKAPLLPQPVAQTQDLAAATTAANGFDKKNQKISSAQATAPRAATSSTPMATATRPRRAAPADQVAGRHHSLRQQPDAATGTLAHQGGPKTPASQLPTTASVLPTPAATATAHQPETPVLATTAPAAGPEIIEVEVRRGTPRPAPAAAVAAAEVAPVRRRGLRLGGLLRQADHLVHGETVGLAEATGLPETVTLQARLGGRLLSKTIQL